MDLAAMTLRSNIIEEDRLRREIAREQALLSEHPDYWKQRERERIARNRKSAALTRRLRAAGLRAAYRELSLKQKLKKLQRLVNQNRAETEIFRQTK